MKRTLIGYRVDDTEKMRRVYTSDRRHSDRVFNEWTNNNTTGCVEIHELVGDEDGNLTGTELVMMGNPAIRSFLTIPNAYYREDE